MKAGVAEQCVWDRKSSKTHHQKSRWSVRLSPSSIPRKGTATTPIFGVLCLLQVCHVHVDVPGLDDQTPRRRFNPGVFSFCL